MRNLLVARVLPSLLTLLALCAWLAPAAAQEAAPAAAPEGPCATPYAAVDVLLSFQQPDNLRPKKAAACLDLSEEPDASVGPERARQIKDILDARGLWVKMESLPKDPDHEDEAGNRRYVLFPSKQPELWLEKVGDQWLWSASSVSRAPALYADTFAVDLQTLSRRLPEWMQGSVLGLEIWKILGLLILILLALFVRVLVVLVVTSQLRRWMGKLGVTWGEELLNKVSKPLGVLAAAATAALLLPALRLPVKTAAMAVLVVKVLAAFSLVWAAYRLIDLFVGWLESKAAATETKMDDQLVPLVATALKVFTVALGVVFVLQNLDVDVGSLLAGLGIGGLAFALAAQDTVKNLFGALTIFLDRPFHIGDWVATAGTEGVVESVGFRSVRIRTFYNSLISVPNARVADSTVDNYGARQYRRVKATLGLTYDTSPDQMQAFVEGIRAILKANPATRKDVYEIHFRDFGQSSLEVMLYFFLKVPGWSEELKARHDIFLEILRLAKELNVDFAFPTQTLHVESVAEAGKTFERETPEGLAEVIAAFGPEGSKSRPEGRMITEGYYAEKP
ncbi:MAG: mechanosensitive ion channel family protein [Deltaproteobacteria bacterium]|nr:mechanosensitive ion channel family protein [Deltaproteobacteria bacterium]